MKIIFLTIIVSFLFIGCISQAPTKVETTSQQNIVQPSQEEVLKGFLQEKFKASTKAELSDIAIDGNIISITIESSKDIEVVLIDVALVLNRHPEVIFDKVVLTNGTEELSFTANFFGKYRAGEINDLEFIEGSKK